MIGRDHSIEPVECAESCTKSAFSTLYSPLNGWSTIRMNKKTRPMATDVPDIMTKL